MPSSLVVDQSPPPTAAAQVDMMIQPGHELRLRNRHLHRRQKDDEDDEGSSTRGGAADKTKTADDEKETKSSDEEGDEDDDTKSSKTVAPTKTLSEDPDDIATRSLSVAPSASPTESEEPDEDTPLPEPFDGTPSTDFVSVGGDESCPNYVSALLNSETFKDCYPLSMMLFTSSSFFDAKRQLTSLVRVLDAACDAEVESCATFMSTAAQNLTAEENCKEEYDDGVRHVMDAYKGLMNYQVVYTATCLEDPDTDMYCFANAVTNSSNSSDTYVYSLPYDLELPGSSTPTCNWCNKETMGIFHAASANRDLLISNTYEEAARQFNNLCDVDYVNGTLPEAVESSGPFIFPPRLFMTGTLLAAGAVGWFW